MRRGTASRSVVCGPTAQADAHSPDDEGGAQCEGEAPGVGAQVGDGVDPHLRGSTPLGEWGARSGLGSADWVVRARQSRGAG